MHDDFTDVQRSYGRCLRSGQMIDRFYELLMESCPEVRPSFARTNFAKQRRALRRGITSAILYAGGSELVTRTIDEMADVHSRQGRAPVKPHLYSYWIDSLVQAVRENDPEVDPALESRWRQALQGVIDRFIARY